MVQHSYDFRLWLHEFSEQNKSNVLSSAFSSLRAAKHRFESLSSPISLLVLDMDAHVSLALKIAEMRKGTQAACNALAFLSLYSEELVLVLALLADAGDEALCIIRHFDNEETDSSLTTSAVQEFLDRIAWLFIAENVWTTEGHTAIALRYHHFSFLNVHTLARSRYFCRL